MRSRKRWNSWKVGAIASDVIVLDRSLEDAPSTLVAAALTLEKRWRPRVWALVGQITSGRRPAGGVAVAPGEEHAPSV